MFSQYQQQNQEAHSSITALPKAELHVHIEGGTLTPAKLKVLASRHGLPEPELIYGPNNTLLFKKHDFTDFLNTYEVAASYILTVQDIEEVAFEYLESVAKMGAIYVEMSVSPEHVSQNREKILQGEFATSTDDSNDKIQFLHQLNPILAKKYKELPDIHYSDFIHAIAKAIDRAQKLYDIEARILIILLRHNGAEFCHRTLDNVIAHRHPYVVGINLAGDEVRFPPELYQSHYARAKEAGLKCTAHVGEHAGADSIKKAIELLKLDRIGHGTTILENEDLVKVVLKHNIGIEANISSNIKLNVINNAQEHPFEILLFNGVLCSLNTDDPTYFDTNLENEYKLASQTWQLTEHDLLQVTRNAIHSAFCDSELKSKLLAKCEAFKNASQQKSRLNAAP